MLDEISRLADLGPSEEEMERGRVQAEAQFVYRLQTVGGFGGKSDQLNAYHVFVGDPAYFEQDLKRYETVTAASTLQLHLTRGARQVTLSVVPRGRTTWPYRFPSPRVMGVS